MLERRILALALFLVPASIVGSLLAQTPPDPNMVCVPVSVVDGKDAYVAGLQKLTNSANPHRVLLVLTDGFDVPAGDPARTLQEYAKKEDVPVYVFFATVASPGGGGRRGTGQRAAPQPQPAPARGEARGVAPETAAGARGTPVARGVTRGAVARGGSTVFAYDDLTSFTGGRVEYVNAETQLRASLTAFAEELKSQYVLGFKSTNQVRNDKWRDLDVRITPPAGQRNLKPNVKDRYFVAK